MSQSSSDWYSIGQNNGGLAKKQPVPSPGSGNQNYMIFPGSTQNSGGLAATAQPNVLGKDYSLSNLLKNRSPAQASSVGSSGTAAAYDDALFENASQQPVSNASSSLLEQNNSLEVANADLQKKLDTKQENVTGPGRTMSNVLAGGTLGLGVASFIDNQKTAKLQRSAMKENLQMARDDQAARKRRTAGWANAFGGNE